MKPTDGRTTPQFHSLHQHSTNVSTNAHYVISVYQTQCSALSTPPLPTRHLSQLSSPSLIPPSSPQRFHTLGKLTILQNKMGPLFTYSIFQLASVLTLPENPTALTNFGKLVFNKFIPLLLIWRSLRS